MGISENLFGQEKRIGAADARKAPEGVLTHSEAV
jgi:hypothetical protein